MLAALAATAVVPETPPESLDASLVAERLSPVFEAIRPDEYGEFLREDAVQKSDTVASLLARLGVFEPALVDFVRTHPKAAAAARQLRPGQGVAAYTDAGGRLRRLLLPSTASDSVLVISRTDGRFSASEEIEKPERYVDTRSAEIRHSLFGATDAAGIPDPVAMQLVEVFGGSIDFHRDLRRGDRFSVSYEMLRIRGKFVRSGRILAAEFVNGGKSFTAVWNPLIDGGGYYDANGRSTRKAFLRSPIEFSRVTSGYSARRLHPVLNEWRAHRGVDYAAPIGTRVRATSDGTVDFVGRQGGYGNLVVLRHGGGYATAYGHLNGFAKGLQKGRRVGQGETIGFVGKTGLASGPHLHYEFRIADRPVNPLATNMPESPPLDARELAAFKPHAAQAIARLADAGNGSGLRLD